MTDAESMERNHQARILCALIAQLEGSEKAEEKEVLKERIAIQREILFEGDRIVKGLSDVKENLKGHPLEVIATVNVNPSITIRRGFFGSKNSGIAEFKYPFGAVKIILKHIDGEEEFFKITDDDLRFIPVIVRYYWPINESATTKKVGGRKEWRVKYQNRILVLVTEKEGTRLGSFGFETVITFYVQNPKKMKRIKPFSQKK